MKKNKTEIERNINIFLLFFFFFVFSFPFFPQEKKVFFAGGCFWCMESPFDKTKGVLATRAGYLGGTKESANYEEVSKGETDHLEAIEITYNDEEVKLEELLAIFWQNIDPYDGEGQFCDKGKQYRSAFFYQEKAEKKIFEESLLKAKLDKEKVKTLLSPFSTFYPAEEYHQDYYQKNPLRYKFYRYNCGRDKRLQEIHQKERKKEK